MEMLDGGGKLIPILSDQNLKFKSLPQAMAEDDKLMEGSPRVPKTALSKTRTSLWNVPFIQQLFYLPSCYHFLTMQPQLMTSIAPLT